MHLCKKDMTSVLMGGHLGVSHFVLELTAAHANEMGAPLCMQSWLAVIIKLFGRVLIPFAFVLNMCVTKFAERDIWVGENVGRSEILELKTYECKPQAAEITVASG